MYGHIVGRSNNILSPVREYSRIADQMRHSKYLPSFRPNTILPRLPEELFGSSVVTNMTMAMMLMTDGPNYNI